MSAIVTAALGGAWLHIMGWVLPTSLTLAVFGIGVLPSLRNLPPFDVLAASSPATQALVLLAASIGIGWLLSIIQVPLYRVLEGYLLWPANWRASRTAFHKRRHETLSRSVLSSDLGDGLERDLAKEASLRYPAESSQIGPTLLGNAIRRFEYYAHDRYRLDSQHHQRIESG